VALVEIRQIVGPKLTCKPGKAVVIDDRDPIPGKRLTRVDTHHGDGERALQPFVPIPAAREFSRLPDRQSVPGEQTDPH
jgi:hypothetical protein